ncbi:tetratricopeptide repeat protein [Reichenbachiella sp.]|uniref:tetratricopeptide repeat protein n=1 Tax=Reichenbachiella sp. TaxID=2184521 RepID=UPI0032988E48
MHRLSYFLILIVMASSASAQMYRVDNALKFLETDSLSAALREINFAINHPRTSNYARTWSHYYQINLKRYHNASLREKRDEIIPMVIEGYSKCKNLDADLAYLPWLDSSFRTFTQYYKDNAKQMLNENQLVEYIYFQEAYIACLDALGKPVGFQYFQLGESNMRLRNYEVALQDFQHAIEHKFREEESYLDILLLLGELERKKERELVYVKALQRFPNSEKLHHLDIHQALYKQLSFKAKSTITKRLEEGESGSDLYMMLGDANDQMGLYDEAIDAYETAVKIDSTDFYNCLKVGTYLLHHAINNESSQFIDQSKRLLESCQKFDPNDLVMLQSLRRLYVETKNIDAFNEVNERIESLTN